MVKERNQLKYNLGLDTVNKSGKWTVIFTIEIPFK